MKYEKIILIIFGIILFTNIPSLAHCDGIDGPVVKAAQKSLEENNINYVLAWIKPDFEKQVLDAFDKVMSIRNQNELTKEVADYFFYETVVRLHREGEGESYTGLKPAGRELSPAILLADESVESGGFQKLKHLIIESVSTSFDEKSDLLLQKKNFNTDNVEAGREFVESYVNFIHFAEKMYDLSQIKPGNHSHDLY